MEGDEVTDRKIDPPSEYVTVRFPDRKVTVRRELIEYVVQHDDGTKSIKFAFEDAAVPCGSSFRYFQEKFGMCAPRPPRGPRKRTKRAKSDPLDPQVTGTAKPDNE